MKTRTKVLAILFAACLLLGTLVGCGGLSETIDGDSAYEIAVKNGFVGTEQEWLASLRGDSLTPKDLYDAAVAEGYTGSYYDYLTQVAGLDGEQLLSALKEELGQDIAINMAEPLLSSVSIIAGFTNLGSNSGAKSGSGVIYQLNREMGDAYIITNYHVLYHEGKVANEISVFLYGGEYADFAIPATFVGGSERYDIAVLQVKGSNHLKTSSAMAVTVGNSCDISVGNSVVAIGNAMGEGISLTVGVISVDSETISLASLSDPKTTIQYRVMRIDTAVNEGNSGGGLFDAEGRLIGIVNAKTIYDSVENMGYAIPVNIAVGVAQNIIDNCDGNLTTSPIVVTIGATVYPLQSGAYLDPETNTTRIREKVAILEIVAGSPASRNGLRSGDVLLSYALNDEEPVSITRTFTMVDALLHARVGDTLTIVVNRNGVEKTVSFILTQDMFSERA